jgi:hypothetical protein
MSVDAADVLSLLPPDQTVGSVRVVGVDTADDFDSQGDEAIRIILTLADPASEVWEPLDVLELEAAITRGLIRGGEDRSIIFWIRPEHDPDALDEDPPHRFPR